MLVDWLAQRTHLVGVIWIDASEWRKSARGRLVFFRQRIRLHGLWKTFDEMAFYAYYHRFHAVREYQDLERRVIQPVRERLRLLPWQGEALNVSDVNSREALDFVRRLDPDVGFAMCVRNYFGGELRGLMKHGVFLWHDGFTPEYRGLHSPFWAVHNLDFEHIGFTLLRMDDTYDAGEIFVQGRASGVNVRRDLHEFVGHKAIADGLPQVERFIAELEAGAASPIKRDAAPSGYYTYAGLSDCLRQRMRLRRLPERALTVED